MKVCIKNSSSGVNKDQIDVVSSFIHFLQDQVPLSKDIHITFTDNEKDTVTTGMRVPGSKMFILAKNRMLIDILRTLSHEWVHEYQFQKQTLRR